ncbi:MAG TPA: DUF2959 family protein [Verrucomicrobiae bacterium]|jgi:hypothetical protein|nr:DUF2959 family protein [Verrucomicrobiae bacterium]
MATKDLTIVAGRRLVRVFQTSACVFALLHFTGCATGNYKKADAASESLRRASLQIDAENHCIDVTLADLDTLVNKPAPDLKPQFKTFSASLNRLADSADRADKAAAVANDKSKDYFQNWDKETAAINFEAVREQSVSRKTQVSNEFNTVNQRYRENQAVIWPLISYLRDIRTALSTDLTMDGLQSVKPLAENAKQNARKVQSALSRLTGDLAASRSQMSSIVVRETEAKGGAADTVETTRDQGQSAP